MSLSGRAAAAGAARRRTRIALLPAMAALLFLAAAAPVALVKTPIMVDFFNHLGRIYVIAHLDHDPLLQHYYALDWKIIPNLAMDAAVPILARHLGIYLAGKLFVLGTMALILSGVAALHAALWRRLSLWPLAAFPFIYNWIFLYGFVNYLFGVGLALWAAAAWIRTRDRPALAGGLSLAFALALFASHLYALGLYGLTIASYEGWRLAACGLPARRRLAAELAAFALPFLAALSLMAFSPTSGYVLDTYWNFRDKLDGLYFVVKTYWAPADLAFAAACAAALAWGLARRRLRVHPAGWVMLAAAAATYLAMPAKLLGSGIADMRLPIAALYILIAMTRWQVRGRTEAALLCAGIAALALCRDAVIGIYWHRYDGIVARFERSFADIRPGSAVLVAGRYDTPYSYTQQNMLAHMPCLVMIERSSLESLAFTHPGKQVLVAAPPYRAISLFEGEPPDITQLTAPWSADNAPGSPWAGWRAKFDYVYLLYSDGRTLGPADGLRLLFDGGEFQLYRIVR